MQQRRGLGRQPQVATVVHRGLVGAQAQGHAGGTHLVKGHDAAAKAQVAHRVVRHGAPGGGEQRDISVIDPDGVDDHHIFVQQPQFVHITHQRLAELVLAQHALQLGFEDVDVEGQRVLLAKVRQCAQIRLRDALWRGAGHGSRQAPAFRAVPARDEVLVEREQFLGALPRRAFHGAPLGFGQQILEEGIFFVLDDIGLVYGHGGTHAAIGVGLHDGVHCFACGKRNMKGIVVHAGDAALEHFNGAEHGAHIGS